MPKRNSRRARGLWPHVNTIFQLDVRGRASDQDFYFFLLHYEPMAGFVPVGKVGGFEWKRNGPGLAGFKINPFEPPQLLERPLHFRSHVLHVHLDHFITSASAGVLYVYAHRDGTVCMKTAGTLPQVGVFERGVTQAIAEGKKWLAFEVHVS